MKIISYSLFSHSTTREFERLAYIRIFFWNCRMARLIYPSWQVHLEVAMDTYAEFQPLFEWLKTNNGLSIEINDSNPPLCRGMIWRMKPCFKLDVTHVLCRDADALVTFREAQRVQQWLEGGKGVHSILDNPAHSGLMGGMVGFETAKLKAATSWNTWDEMVAGWDLTQRGSDQNLLTHTHDSREANQLLPSKLPGVDGKFWTSNLCTFFIGAAGVNELETIRWFKSMDEYNYAAEEIQKQFPKLFYWL
jgi:hypothetical protein